MRWGIGRSDRQPNGGKVEWCLEYSNLLLDLRQGGLGMRGAAAVACR